MNNRKLGRTADHRKALLRNQATALILKEKIETTEMKAMELRSVVDNLITLGKKGDLASRRSIASYVFDEEAVKKVCDEKGIKLEYVFQEMDAIPEGFSVPEGRGKPWGTGQAVLAAKDVINEPFMVINADDYYGKEAFRSIHDFIAENEDDGICCMAGFIIKNTLSDHGTVTRGVCKVRDDGYLTDIVETSDIEKTETGAKAGDQTFDENTNVSMNMWGFRPCLMDSLDKGFKEFFENIGNNPLKAEYLLPSHVGDLLKAGALKVKVLPTHDKWLGITYQEDKPLVIEGFKKMLADGVYSEDLFSDL